mgnify:CR=1 FL=1
MRKQDFITLMQDSTTLKQQSSNNNSDLSAKSKTNVEWSNHGYKHFPQSNINWKDIVKSSKNGPAKYTPGTNIEELERMVWEKGIPVTNGKTWKVMEFKLVLSKSIVVKEVFVCRSKK